MSSPLSMLKKTKRTPLQSPVNEKWSSQNVPFRRNLLKEFQAELADNGDNKSSDQHGFKTSQSPVDPASHSRSKAPLKKGAPPSDFELMSAMMRRVTLLEQTVRSQTQEIEQKDKTISALEEKLRLLKASESPHDTAHREAVERQCQELHNQVCEMENFLSDYGLIWVGDTSGELHDSEEGLCQTDASEVRNFHMNFDLVLQRIKELNVLSGAGECFIQSTPTGAQLAKKDPIQLSLYRNGIVMFNGPFRSYQEQSTKQCMQDLMDGYFPSELQDRFPDGVPFEVHDRRDKEFNSRLPWSKFPGVGQAVLHEKDEASNIISSRPSHGKKLSMDQFLNKLPRVMVKAGRVIDVRDSLRTVLQDSPDDHSSSVIHVDTPALHTIKERLQTSSDRPPSAGDVITLKVKSEDGNHTYILKMSSSETIGDLRHYLDKHRGVGPYGYDIISAYPQCCYGDESHTLQTYGLSTNATLLLQKRKNPDSSSEF